MFTMPKLFLMSTYENKEIDIFPGTAHNIIKYELKHLLPQFR